VLHRIALVLIHSYDSYQSSRIVPDRSSVLRFDPGGKAGLFTQPKPLASHRTPMFHPTWHRFCAHCSGSNGCAPAAYLDYTSTSNTLPAAQSMAKNKTALE